MYVAARVLLAMLISSGLLSAQDSVGRFEFTASYWFPDVRGAVRSTDPKLIANSVDLRSDLGIEQQRLTSFGRLVVKPGRKHGIVVEGTPFRLRGLADVARGFSYGNNGQTFPISDTAQSSVDLLYLFGGYRYDMVLRPSGHFGIVAGVAYLNADGSIKSLARNLSASDSRSFALPLVGAEFHRDLTPGRHPLSIGGDAKGMWAGDYGKFATGTLQLGVLVMKNLTVKAGYGVTELDLHTKTQNILFKSTFAGPIVSMDVRYR